MFYTVLNGLNTFQHEGMGKIMTLRTQQNYEQAGDSEQGKIRIFR